MTKKITRKEQAEQTRAHIIKVCRELMTEQSLEKLSIQDICSAAEVSVGTFYHHFMNKSGIIIELYREVDATFTTTILPSLIEHDPCEAIIEYLCEQCHYAEINGLAALRNLYKAQIDYGSEFFLSYERGLPQGLYGLIGRAIEKGALKSCTDAKGLMEELLIISRGTIYYWCTCAGTIDIQEYIRKLAGTYLSNYKV